ncbi:MAG: integrase arm-type DNA-binding domain-containing protein [Gammaproteobacteria bacterium]|nr:integrase arm-type DNA-binding domain-containing protein [Gammaproteobacteria bacterium]
MKITKLFVDKIPIPIAEIKNKTVQKRYYDTVLKGFGVRATSGGSKAFFVEKSVSRKLRRITIGRYPELTVEQARKEAQKLLGKIATGIDPVGERKEHRAKATTLKDVFAAYLNVRKELSSVTIFDYQRVMKQSFSDWASKPLMNITKDMVAKRHTQIGEKSKARANLSMRFLRAIFNFAAGEYEDANGKSLFLENPVKRLSHTRAWYRIERKQTVIKPHELPAWYKAVMEVEDERSTGKAELLRDYFLLILFTGLRREEAARITWDQIDLTAKTLTIPNTKNHLTHVLPLSNFLYELLLARRLVSDTNYVFPGNGKTGYNVEPRKVMNKIIKQSGVTFTLHDLRRTFITIAESLDIPAYALKRLLNHKMNHDVTAGYIIMDVERLRKPMQQITDHLLSLMDAKPQGEIFDLKSLKKPA